jgi:hypothetical protein
MIPNPPQLFTAVIPFRTPHASSLLACKLQAPSQANPPRQRHDNNLHLNLHFDNDTRDQYNVMTMARTMTQATTWMTTTMVSRSNMNVTTMTLMTGTEMTGSNDEAGT